MLHPLPDWHLHYNEYKHKLQHYLRFKKKTKRNMIIWGWGQWTVLACTTRLPQNKIHKTRWTFIQKQPPQTYAHMTQYVNKAAGWAGTRVYVCRALVMANNKSGVLFVTDFISMRFGFALAMIIRHTIYIISGQGMNLRWGGVGRQDKWTVPAGVKVKDWTAKQEDREVVC